ncbi:PREDICTED: uncharacterized protein LOC109587583 isoform X2 [Amphimedon queenslandica]|uniref:Uncharacterized protein n=1 Tax=Amphimedon queenslandica TaxID=400682 RepID=A0AAN0JRA7_AMPQE|nr:PREDICTED: uncharacterized protein LOC109587583 isoform X2 [Amphimedon queenslandica]|eukprot:XP_019859372.1 PREDICTED: uncharacterized protein LOC109587583 isoform X2 [Amphimedon queenslandica]
MRQLRRRGHCIQSGDTTHEDVARDYMQLFVQRNSLESIRKKEAGQRASELKKILEIAYSACKNHVIEIAKNELAMLFKPPVRVLTELERKNEDIYLPWQSRQEALSLLLSNSKIRNQCVPDDLTDEVIKELSKQCEYHSAGMHTVLKQVAELTWKMVNLSPPVSLGYLPFSEDLDLYDVTDVKDLLGAEEKYKVEYRRPILFFGSSGIVGSKGSIAIYPFAEHSKLDGAGMLPDDKITSDNTPTFDLSENKEKNESEVKNEERTHLCGSSKVLQESVQFQSGANQMDTGSKPKKRKKKKKKSREKPESHTERDGLKSDCESNNSDNELDQVD